MTTQAIYVKTAAAYPVILGKYPNSVVKYVAYDNFRKKTVIAKGSLLDGGAVINSAYHLHLNEDELLAFQRYLRDVKSFKDVYEVLSETKRGNGLTRLVVKTNQWGRLVLQRTNGVPRVTESVVTAADSDPNPTPLTDEQFDADIQNQIEWKDGYEQFNVSGNNDCIDISKKILKYYSLVPSYGEVEEPKPQRVNNKRKAPPKKKRKVDDDDDDDDDDVGKKAKAPLRKKKKVITVEENDDDDDDDAAESSVGRSILPLSYLFTLMHDTGKSIVECITEDGDLLASICEDAGVVFDYIDFYKMVGEKSIMDFYNKAKEKLSDVSL